MSTQWHPLFAHLLRLQIEAFYRVETEVPVSELPRKGDILLLRRTDGPEPSFTGLWSHLTDWNVLEFKGPTDVAEPADLDLLLHVGTGIAYRLNEERRERGDAVLPNRRVSFWYLAPFLGETFLEQARSRVDLLYETGGVWRGRVWGHLVFLVNCRDLAVELDAVPLLLLRREPRPPRALGELLVREADTWGRFGMWLAALQPGLWEEVVQMASNLEDGPVLHLENVIKMAGAGTIIKTIGVERVLHELGLERVLREVGVERIVHELGVERAIEVIGLDRVIETVGREKLLQRLLPGTTPEQVQKLLREGAGQEKGSRENGSGVE